MRSIGAYWVAIVLIPVVVACSPQATQASELMPVVEADLIADAIVRACERECTGFELHVRSDLHTALTRLDSERPMSDLIVDAIAGRIDGVRFVGRAEIEALFGDDELVDRGNGILISAGPVEVLASDVVGVEVGLVTARDGGHGGVFQFSAGEDGWRPVTSEDTVIVTTSWVS